MSGEVEPGYRAPGSTRNCINAQTGKSGWPEQYARFPAWHGGRVNWVDGHVKFLEQASLMDYNDNGKTDEDYTSVALRQQFPPAVAVSCGLLMWVEA